MIRSSFSLSLMLLACAAGMPVIAQTQARSDSLKQRALESEARALEQARKAVGHSENLLREKAAMQRMSERLYELREHDLHFESSLDELNYALEGLTPPPMPPLPDLPDMSILEMELMELHLPLAPEMQALEFELYREAQAMQWNCWPGGEVSPEYREYLNEGELTRLTALHALMRQDEQLASAEAITIARSDKNWAMRAAAIRSLSRVQDAAVVSFLREVLKSDTDQRVRLAAVQALAVRPEPEAREALRELLQQ